MIATSTSYVPYAAHAMSQMTTGSGPPGGGADRAPCNPSHDVVPGRVENLQDGPIDPERCRIHRDRE